MASSISNKKAEQPKVTTKKGNEHELLVLILDTNPFVWGEADGKINFEKFLEASTVFLNSHLLLSHSNHVAVVASHNSKSALIYPVDSDKKYDSTINKENTTKNQYEAFNMINVELVSRLRRYLAKSSDGDNLQHSMVSAALGIALCYINRFRTEESKSKLPSRILVLSASIDHTIQYLPIMNSIYASEKAKIPIDACIISNNDSGFFQQACKLTHGTYLKIELNKSNSLLQYLLTVFLPSASIKNALKLPKQSEVDFRAACFCHNRIVSVGYVCSVCLSIYCEDLPICSTCQSRFRPWVIK